MSSRILQSDWCQVGGDMSSRILQSDWCQSCLRSSRVRTADASNQTLGTNLPLSESDRGRWFLTFAKCIMLAKLQHQRLHHFFLSFFLSTNGLKAFNGDDASAQPGNLQELLLHETSVSWIRRREKITRSTSPWKETAEQFTVRMRNIVQEINDTLNVEGLCRALPKRIQKLVDAEGDRITH